MYVWVLLIMIDKIYTHIFWFKSQTLSILNHMYSNLRIQLTVMLKLFHFNKNLAPEWHCPSLEALTPNLQHDFIRDSIKAHASVWVDIGA